MKFVGWIAAILVVCLLVWLSIASSVLWPNVVLAVLLVGCGVLAGLRIGTQSTASYIAELQRVNKVLCGQQRELEEVNSILLKQVGADSEPVAPAETASRGEHVH